LIDDAPNKQELRPQATASSREGGACLEALRRTRSL